MMSFIVAVVSLALSLGSIVIASLNRHWVIRHERDLAVFERDLLARLNGLYMSRREIERLIQERDLYRETIDRRINEIWAALQGRRKGDGV